VAANTVSITVSAKDEASGAIARIGANTRAMAADVERATAQTKANLGSLRAPAAVAGVALVGIGIASTKMASDLAEAKNAVKETFGAQGAAVIDDFAKGSADAFGISKRAANEYAATLGAIFKSGASDNQQAAQMSRDAVKLAADLGSLRNLGVDEALEKIRAGLVGEAEPLRAVGILLSDDVVKQAAYRAGIAKTGEALTEGQKVQARWLEIVRQAGPALGDFGRTLETSLPNQMKVAQASTEDLADALGERLIPAARNSIRAVNDVIDAVDDLPAPAESAAVGIAGTTAALIGLGLAISPVKLIKNNLAELWAVVRLGVAAVGGTAAAATAGAAAIAVAGTAFAAYKGLAEAAAMQGNEFASSTKRAMDEGGDAVQATVADFAGLRGELQSDLEAFKAAGKDTTALERQVSELDEMLRLLREAANAIPGAMDAAGNGMAGAAKDAEELTRRVTEGAAAMAAMISTATMAAVREREAMFPSGAEDFAGRGEAGDFPKLTGTDAVKKLQEDSRRIQEAFAASFAASGGGSAASEADPLGDAIAAIQSRFNSELAHAFVTGGEQAFNDLRSQQDQIRAEIGRTADALMQKLGVDLPTALGLAAEAVTSAADAIQAAGDATQQRFNRELAEAFLEPKKGGLEAYNKKLAEQGPLFAEIAHAAQQLMKVMGIQFPEAYSLATDVILAGVDKLKNVVRNDLQGFLGKLAARRSAIGLNAIEGFNVRPELGAGIPTFSALTGSSGGSERPIEVTINRRIDQMIFPVGTDERAVVQAVEQADEPLLRQVRQTFADAR
jgi:hypothetical protein